MDLDQLRSFVSAAEELQYFAAARRLGIDAGRVSSAIRRLEHELGVTLFVRSSQGVRLTAAGADLYPEAAALLLRADNLVRIARSHRLSDERVLVVGLFLGGTAAAELTFPIIDTFRAQHPHVDLKLVTLDLFNWAPAVIHGLVDAALVPGPVGHAEVELAPLFHEQRVLTVSVNDPLADAQRVTLPEIEILQRYPWSSQGNQPRPFYEFFLLGDIWDLADLNRGGPAPQAAGDLAEEVYTGHLVGSMPLSIARHLPRDRVHTVEVAGLPDVTIGVVRRPGNRSSTVDLFVDSARSTVEQLLQLVPGATLARPPVDVVRRRNHSPPVGR